MKEKKVKILHVIGIMNYGGAETMIMNLYRKIDRNRFQFDFLIHRDQEGDYDNEIKELGGNIYRLPEYKIFNYFSYKKACKDFFKNHSEYDIVHGHIESCAAIYLTEAKKQGIYTVAHCHSTGFQSFLPKILYNSLTYKTRFVADYFFACSKLAGQNRYGNKIVESDKFKVFNNGIDAKNYIYSEKRQNTLKKKWGVEDKFVIGHVGRMAKEKNQIFLLYILKEVLKKKNDSVLILVGDGVEKKQLKKIAYELEIGDKVIFTGNRSDVPDMMNLFDVFVFPSIYEGLGIALIEAQAAGLPCVIADTIVDEAILTRDIEVLSLNDSYQTWGNKIIEASTHKRNINYELVCKAGFDIETTTNELQEFYLKHAK